MEPGTAVYDEQVIHAVQSILDVANMPMRGVGVSAFGTIIEELSSIETHHVPAELEIRFGRALPNAFDPNISPRLAGCVIGCLERLGEVRVERTIISRFAEQHVVTSHGLNGEPLWARQKTTVASADLVLTSCPWDARLAYSLEIPVKNAPHPSLATQRLLRTRYSVRLGCMWQVDVSADTDLAQRQDSYQIELELVGGNRIPSADALLAHLTVIVNELKGMVEETSGEPAKCVRLSRYKPIQC